MRFALTPLLFILLGCPGPTVGEGGQSQPGNNNPPPVQGGQPGPDAGAAPPPDPAIGAAPPADGGGGGSDQQVNQPIPSTATRMEAEGFKVEAGKGVKLSGTYTYNGKLKGAYRIDFLQGLEALPRLLHSITLEQPGPWEVEAPAGLGKVNLVAYVDLDNNGPGFGEPAIGSEPITVGNQPVLGIDLTFDDRLFPNDMLVPTGAPVVAGSGVLLSGSVAYAGDETGPVQIFVVKKPGEKDKKKSSALYIASLEAAGDWSLEVPKKLGEIDLLAVMDIGGDGPTLGDPQGTVSKLVIGDAPFPGLAIQLSNEPQPPPH